MNRPAGMTTGRLPGRMTVTLTVPEPDGLRTVIWLSALILRSVPGTPPKQTAVTLPRALPVIVTSSPPVPEDGEIAVTSGCGVSSRVLPTCPLPSGPVGTGAGFPDLDGDEPCALADVPEAGYEHAKPPEASATAIAAADTTRRASKPPAWWDPWSTAIDTTRPQIRPLDAQFSPLDGPRVHSPASASARPLHHTPGQRAGRTNGLPTASNSDSRR